jgi:hypothetical protein
VSAELTAALHALEHLRDTFPKTAHVYVATRSREALSAIEKGHKVRRGREVVHKIADAILEMESVGHRVTVFLVPLIEVFAVLPTRNRLQEQSSTTAASSQPPRPRGARAVGSAALGQGRVAYGPICEQG